MSLQSHNDFKYSDELPLLVDGEFQLQMPVIVIHDRVERWESTVVRRTACVSGRFVEVAKYTQAALC